MAGKASDYHHGEMDIHAQQQTFVSVMTVSKWASLAIAVGVLFLTLWFCTAAGFLTALISAVALLAVGIFALRERAAPAHRPAKARRMSGDPIRPGRGRDGGIEASV